MGWSQPTTSKVMAGSRVITADELVALLRWFGYGSAVDAPPGEVDAIKRAESAEIMALASDLPRGQRKALRAYLEALDALREPEPEGPAED